MLQRVLLFVCYLALTLTVSGCHHLPWIYRADIQQGNFYDQEMTRKLHVGLSKNEVLDIMGEPITIDTFNNNRWNYIYTLQTNGGCIMRKHITLTFRNDVVANIEQTRYRPS